MEWTKLCYFTWDTAVFGIPLQFDPEVREGVVRAFSLWPINNGKMSCMYRVNKNSETVKYKFFAVWFFFFLFHLSLLLSILWPSISRFVKPVRLFSSKMVGFRDKKNKQYLRTNLRTGTFLSFPLHRMGFFSSYKGDYMSLSKILFIKSLC